MLSFDVEELKRVYADLFCLSHIKFDLWDENRNLLFSYPQKHRRFCRAIKEYSDMGNICLKSDEDGFAEVDRTGKTYVFRCPFGLTEAFCPIIRNGQIIGYITCGQAIEEENAQDIIRRIRALPNLGDEDKDKLCGLIENATKTDVDKITACADVMSMISSYLWQKNIVNQRHSLAFRKATDYIMAHISEEISVQMLSEYLNMSQTSLYSLAVENCGTGMSEYIRKLRMEKAEELLVETDEDIQMISETVGIPDKNYFSKLFKKKNGITPAQYRKKNC